ncbi:MULTISPECIES: YihY/virulence factor BrkB family protein [unclassified Paenibacillus]|uniref:YihY/virulence factor BrkB family protein n=1 Tax=unclassified Paenibacillus TaxID=185978 RepID=UPI001AEAB407|nr:MULTISPECIES: YihY/virulence factor BrkB family protein [unclassified Paenibacillus]MBP1155904.1 membrane protein [Paenibacillus sp. PvP091]MBP1168710.1 membrane protein [Paenibacillus sp. PvR098]MBP2439738.1 membrane protein [Paenibacillus sp. PvP052]
MSTKMERGEKGQVSYGSTGKTPDVGKSTKPRLRLSGFLLSLYCRFQDDDVPAMGAQLTYYLILSFFPFLIFVIAVLSFTDLNTKDGIEGLTQIMPDLSIQLIMSVFNEIDGSKSGSLLSIGLLATLWSASNGVNAVIKALNKAYDEEENRPFWKVRGTSILFTVILAIVILFAFIMLVFGRVIGEMIYTFALSSDGFDTFWRVGQFAIPLVIMVIVFVLLYRFTPNLRLTVKEVLPGAIFATFGWVVTSLLFSFYVNNFGNYTKTYGSIGGIIVLLMWLYLSSIIIVLGGEINATLYYHKEGKQKPVCKTFALTLPFSMKKWFK